jgi:hypothetical protein
MGAPDNCKREELPMKQERSRRLLSSHFLIASALVLCAGLGIAWIDTRPRWDDAGITAGALTRVPPWLAATLAAGPILIAEIPDGPGVLLAIPFALAGACVRRRTQGP